ncbi:hypothetical protein C0216_01815 [Streptomyces globosus]|uniref:Secreted protein n=1 Tax=Streptomyces globosus TaxID=68209 RepID=A0A344TUM1_9ACTN|nr:hypothetical protein [Streptomyces globosus]AXE22342.1 hypothetical protein C0216_01815 [Streptomyces globosus]
MPRGRHRNPEPLHRLLTPTAVAGVSLAGAAAAWLVDQLLVLRLLAALAAAAGIAGAVLMRSWDRAAGRRVAELARERVKDEWRTEERIAELEAALEEARVLRGRLDGKLRAKRVELAGLRGEHAALLRRYATAETERASALEGRRLLAIEATAAPADAPRELPAVTEERTSSGAPTSVGYARAHAALAALARRAEQRAAGPAAIEAGPAAPQDAAPAPASPAEPVAPAEPAAPAPPAAAGEGAALPARRPAAPVAPYQAARRPAPRTMGGFDFFGTKSADRARAAIESVQDEDLADVVGAEALEAHKAETDRAAAVPQARPAAAERGEPAQAGARGAGQDAPGQGEAGQDEAGQVIDLTEHDETEPIDVVRLRSAIS